MSSPSIRGRGRPQQADGPSATDPADLFGALVDEDCRAILRATSERALSAGEISDACEIPSSTAYRKVETLVEAGLLTESIRISSSGAHKSEYECAVTNVEIDLDGGAIECSLEGRGGGSPPAAAD